METRIHHAKRAKDEEHRSVAVIAPDHAEQELADLIDNVVPTRGYDSCRRWSGSAARRAASRRCRRSSRRCRPDSGHGLRGDPAPLAATREHARRACCSAATAMPVRAGGRTAQQVEAEHVYVIPPGKHLDVGRRPSAARRSREERGKRVAVDFSSARWPTPTAPHAAAIVLSGADGDGAIGIKRIKERGGLTIAQDPDEAEHASMPRAAIATGHGRLGAAGRRRCPRGCSTTSRSEARLQAAAGGRAAARGAAAAAGRRTRAALREVLGFPAHAHRPRLLLLQARHHPAPHRAAHAGQRRRRPAGLPRLPAHAPRRGGRAAAGPADLGHQLLPRPRRVRRRWSAAFPRCFEGKGPGDAVRVWVPACATGEEAYSHRDAAAASTRARSTRRRCIQVFATDLDEEAIQTAREGVYPDAIAADVTEERLRRFFVKEHARLPRAARAARDGAVRLARPAEGLAVLAARPGLLPQPADLPQPRGAGARASTSSTSRCGRTGCCSSAPRSRWRRAARCFACSTRSTASIAQRPRPRAGAAGARRAGHAGRAPGARSKRQRGAARCCRCGGFVGDAAAPLPTRGGDLRPARRCRWSELHFRLLERFAPPSVLVDREHDIVHLSESAGRFLQFAGGEPTHEPAALCIRAAHRAARGALPGGADRRSRCDVVRRAGRARRRAAQVVDIARGAGATRSRPDFILRASFAREHAGDRTRRGRAAAPATPTRWRASSSASSSR